MMEPNAPEPEGVSRARMGDRPPVEAGTPNSSGEVPEGRAPLRWPYTSRAQQERAQKAAANAQQSEESSSSDVESEDSSVACADRRGHHGEVVSSSAATSPSPSRAVLDGRAAEHQDASVEAETAASAETFSTRFTTMFVVGAAEAVASGLLPIATKDWPSSRRHT